MAVLAKTLAFPLTYFASRHRAVNRDDTEPAGYFRSLRSTSTRDRRQALGHAQLVEGLAAQS
jgi:hypothetical protein